MTGSVRWAVAIGAAFLVSAVGCEVVRAFALRHALLDTPNARSLHKTPVPRIGGVAVVISVFAAFLSATGTPWNMSDVVFKLLLLGVPVALLGLVDDVKPLPASLRFALQIAVALSVALFLDHRSILVFSGYSLHLPRAAFVALGTVWIVGVLNIYNFMDGMDGLAGSQALFAGAALAYASALAGQTSLALLMTCIAGAAAGFLLHNRPPARIFMGDACSTFLGFMFAAVPMIASTDTHDPSVGTVPFIVGPLALAPFLLDGTFTLLRRALRGEKVWHAHRTHLYQRAVTSGLGHRDVLVRYLAWLAVAAASVVLTTLGKDAIAVLAVLVGLVLTWLWVRGRESSAKA